MVHWADGGASDIENAALLCQRHHSLVHSRRLIAQVRKRPDDRGRYVVWDLTPGGYDRHLEELQAERAAHDPPPMTAERLRRLVQAVRGDDVEDRCWAEFQLAEAAQAEAGEEFGGGWDDVPDEVWHELHLELDDCRLQTENAA